MIPQPPVGGGTDKIHVTDKKVAEAKIKKTAPFIFSTGETFDVGCDLALPVIDDYPEGESNQFPGKINWVRVHLEQDNVSQLEPKEIKYHRALARQQPAFLMIWTAGYGSPIVFYPQSGS